MKRGGPQHPKTIELADSLGVARWGAVGILESLWHFTAQYARRGDIGKHSDRAIAVAIGWEDDPQKLIGGLVATGYVDKCDCHRLRIHDWPDHADQAVTKTKEVEGQGFIACYPKDSGRISSNKAGPVKVKAKEQGKGNGRRQRTRETWLTPFAAAWEERWGAGSEPNYGRLGKALADPVEQHGAEETLKRWRRFLTRMEAAHFATPNAFREGWGQWSEDSLALVPARASPKAQHLDNLLAAGVRGGLRGK